jgi:DNA adenine methylase
VGLDPDRIGSFNFGWPNVFLSVRFQLAMPLTYSTPLRYPGGKSKLSSFIQAVLSENRLIDGDYAEPYAGGAGIAFELLFLECVSRVHLNDLDRAVFCFWDTVVNHTEWLCNKIVATPIKISEWYRQREVYRCIDSAESRELGFAFFFLNRTNRSGILNGGVIGGLDQTGEWKIDARYNKGDLVKRIRKIAAYRSRIALYNQDAADFITLTLPRLSKRTLVYLDPPYFVKGRRLYRNHYKPKDHAAIADLIHGGLPQHWIVSYDNVPEIAKLYPRFRSAVYNLDYSAATRRVGSEIMFFSDDLLLPKGMRIRLPPKK